MIDHYEWHKAVHGQLGVESILQPDAGLRAMLASLPQQGRLWVFTNADETHAESCLAALGVRDLFAGVVAFEHMQEFAKSRPHLLPRPGAVLCKPSPLAFHAALQMVGGASAETTVFLDDSARNIAGAAAAGIRACLVGSPTLCEGAIAAVEDVRELPKAMPELWATKLASTLSSAALSAAAPAEEAV